MSQKELAKRLHVNIHAVYRWENNIAYPSIDLVYDIARLFDVDICRLLTEENRK